MPVKKGRKEKDSDVDLDDDEDDVDLSTVPKKALLAMRAVSREEIAAELKRREKPKKKTAWDWLTGDDDEDDGEDDDE